MTGRCVFCAVVAGTTAAAVVCADDEVVAFLDHRPLFHGHTLLVPRTHVEVLADLPADRVAHLFQTVQRLERAVESAMQADGSMILVNNVISQSVPHLHVHIIPRRRKDGLRFWLGPRQPYPDEGAARDVARRIADRLPPAA